MSNRPSASPRSDVIADQNLAIVVGSLSRPAELRTLPSGTELAALDVTVQHADGPADTVPVSWFDAPAWAAALDVDDRVVVIGRVRRRFFKAGGVTASRTEVVASTVVRARQARRAATALRAALDRLVDAA